MIPVPHTAAATKHAVSTPLRSAEDKRRARRGRVERCGSTLVRVLIAQSHSTTVCCHASSRADLEANAAQQRDQTSPYAASPVAPVITAYAAQARQSRRCHARRVCCRPAEPDALDEADTTTGSCPPSRAPRAPAPIRMHMHSLSHPFPFTIPPVAPRCPHFAAAFGWREFSTNRSTAAPDLGSNM